MKSKKKTQEKEIREFIKQTIEGKKSKEEISEFLEPFVQLKKIDFPASLFSFPKRTTENFDTREDREGK